MGADPICLRLAFVGEYDVINALDGRSLVPVTQH